MCRPQTNDARARLFRQQADGAHHSFELRGFPHPGIALNHSEPVRGLEYHPGCRTLSGGQVCHEAARHPAHQRCHRILTFQHPRQDAFLRIPGLAGNQQVIAVAGGHRHIQQTACLNLRLNGCLYVLHRDFAVAGFQSCGQQLRPGKGQAVALQQRDGKVNSLLCRGMQSGFLLCDGRLQVCFSRAGLQLL